MFSSVLRYHLEFFVVLIYRSTGEPSGTSFKDAISSSANYSFILLMFCFLFSIGAQSRRKRKPRAIYPRGSEIRRQGCGRFVFRVFDFNFPNYKPTYACILSIVSYLMEMKVVSKSRSLFHHSNSSMPLKIVWTRETTQEINKRGKIHSNVNAAPFCLARPTKDAFCPSRYSTRRPQTANSENAADFPA